MQFLRLTLFSVVFLSPILYIGQKAFSRIESEITIKEIDSTNRITTGKMFYDKNLGAIYYSIKDEKVLKLVSLLYEEFCAKDG